jgi:SMI1/KNR4 family protein SUKH-1
MFEYQYVIAKITKKTGVEFRPAHDEDIYELRRLGMPECIVEFYAQFEPEEYIEGPVRIWPIIDIIELNTEILPGYCVSPHGYFVFASNQYGDAYCFDANNKNDDDSPRIVFISHEIVDEEITADDTDKISMVVAKNLLDFLNQFINDTVRFCG